VGRVKDWLIGPPLVAAGPLPTATAAARGPRRATIAAPPTRALDFGTGGEFLAPVDYAGMLLPFWDRGAAMSIPTLSRARDLICSAVGALPFTLYTLEFDDDATQIERRSPPAGWMDRPDPDRTRQWLLSWTVDDLYFHEVAYWHIRDRYATGYPSTFELMPFVDVTVSDDGTTVEWKQNGTPVEVPAADVVEFLSPIEGLLSNGYRAIATAVALDNAAERFASAEVPAGILEEQDGGEDLTQDELDSLAVNFAAARQRNTTAATNKYLKYKESTSDPNRLQLIQGRQYQALEMARLGNVPPYLVGAPSGSGMTYQNAVQARGDLIDFGALPYVGCIEQTLSGPKVTPRGQFVRLDANAWLRNPLTATNTPSPNDLEQAFNTAPAATDNQPQPFDEAPA
jgi:hypothetical protein